jgi:O-methyltransferase
MTSPERMYALYKAVEYVLRAGIEGDFVECGVWRGGSAMIIALSLMRAGVCGRDIYLYDTYEGMTTPTARDTDIQGGDARSAMDRIERHGTQRWCEASLEDVRNNLLSTGYSQDRVVFVKGKVEDTIPATSPREIALLRLDTDWYESTYHEFVHLYPLLRSKGVLILDDYGHWRGSREATERYLSENSIALLLDRVDYTCRVAVKP